jgi:hypothetical protein
MMIVLQAAYFKRRSCSICLQEPQERTKVYSYAD